MNKNNSNIKGAIFLLALLFSCNFIFAQKAECQTKFLAFQEVAKEGDFDAIYTSWLDMRKTCENTEEAIFIKAIEILAPKVEEASASDEKNQMIQKLILIYDDYDKAFPNNKKGNRISKAILLFENKQGSSADIYKFLDQAFTIDNESFVNASVLNIYANLIVEQYNIPEKKINLDQAIEKLDKVYDKAQAEAKKIESENERLLLKAVTETLTPEENAILKGNKNSLREYKNVTDNLNGSMNKLANCETLVAIYQKGFDKNFENALWLERVSDRLGNKKCKTDLYQKALEQLNLISPTAKSSYNLALIARQSRNQEKTIEYFVQSASLQKDNDKKSDIFYLLATTYGNRNKPKAKEFAKKAIEAKPSSGKSYIFLSQLYASSSNECGKDNFEKKAIYWLAANAAKQAGIVEPIMKKSGDELAQDFLKSAPSKAEVSQAKRKTGEQIAFDCWIGETVSIPKL